MRCIRLIVVALLLVPATVVAAPEQPSQRSSRPSERMLTGLAGLAAWEAAAYPPYVSPPNPPRAEALPRPRTEAELTGLAGLAAREAASWSVPSSSARPAANSGLQGGVRQRFQQQGKVLVHARALRLPLRRHATPTRAFARP